MNFLSNCLICYRTDYTAYVHFYAGLHAHATCLLDKYGEAKIRERLRFHFEWFEFDLERERSRPRDESNPPQLPGEYIEHARLTGHNNFSYKCSTFCISCYFPEELKPSHEWYAYWNEGENIRYSNWEVRAPKQIKGNLPDPVICTINNFYKKDSLGTRDLERERTYAELIAEAGRQSFGKEHQDGVSAN